MPLLRHLSDRTTATIVIAVALSCMILAWGCANVLGPWLQRRTPAEFTISAVGASDADPRASGVIIDVLYVDGRRITPTQVDRDPSWQAIGDALFHDGKDVPASLRMRGRNVIACLGHSALSGRVRITRDGVPVTIDCHESSSESIRRVLHESPATTASWAVFWIALFALLAAAALLRPWRGDGNAELWVVLHVAAAHLLIWSSYPLVVSVDSGAYEQEFRVYFGRGEAGYFPPGYSLLIQLMRCLPPGDAIGLQVTALQSVLLILTAVWLRRLLRATVGSAVSFIAALLAGSAPIVLMMGRSVMSESLAYFGIIGALYFSVRAARTSGARAPLLAGLLGGISVVTRVTPLAVVLPFFAAHLLPSPRRGLRPFALSVATLVAVSLAPLIWFKAHGGRFEFAYSSTAHVFNRLVHGGRLLDRDGPATRQILDWLGDEDPRAREHMFTTWSLLDKGHSRDEISDLMGRVVSESIAAHPFTYFTTSLVQAVQQIYRAPAMADAGWLWPPVDKLEVSPVLGVSVPALTWVDTVVRTGRALWPGVVLFALLGGIWVLLRRRSRELLLLVWIVVGIAVPESFIEIWISRRSAMFAPMLLVLAVIGVAVIAAWCIRRRRSTP